MSPTPPSSIPAQKHSVLSRMGRSVTVWLLASQVLTAGAAFLLNLLSSYSLVPEARGFLALFLQLGYLGTTLALLGVERPFVAAADGQFSEMSARIARLVRPGLLLAAGVCLVFGLTLMFFDPNLGVYFLLGGLFLLGNAHLRVLRSGYIASKDWKPFVLTVILSQLGLLATGTIMAFAGVSELHWWVAAYVGSGLIPTCVLAWTTRSGLAGNYSQSEEFRTVRSRGLRLVPASLGNTAMLRSDRLLLPVLASPAALGIYTMAATAIELAAWPVQQWCDSKLKVWADRENRSRRAMIKPMMAAMVVTGVIGVIMAGVVWMAVEALLSDAYQAAKFLLLPLVLAAIVYAATRVQQAMMIAAGWAGQVSIAETVGMVASVLLYILLIPPMGATGAAWSSLAGYVICFIAGMIVWKSEGRS